MTSLTPEQYGRLQQVFLEAGKLPPGERDAFVEERVGDDPAIVAAYHALGDESEIPTAFLDPIAEDIVAGFRDEQAKWSDPASIGPAVGRYRLLSMLGEGGFGIVYEAEQSEPVRRRVAVKVIKPGQDSRAVISRFEAERQALALMDHPFIAKIFDGGTTGPESGHQGLPYFAMELVRGDPITTFCDRERLTIAQRLELMCSVCDAVEHAHKRGIIHRDIKPSNVLVAFHDGVAVPKIIDFGIAKAIGAGLTEHTLFTARGQLIGTPAYMSPEQAEMSGVEIDPRTDVYSLGVLLYEVLTSRPPFDPRTLQSAGHAEMVRIIREVAPQRPSTRLSTHGLSDKDHESAVAIARARRAELHALTRQLRTDLDWVVMRCLEKERDRRYKSAGELGAELRRILNHEPVIAGPPSIGYRTKKFVRRHRAPLRWAAALAIVSGVLTSVIVAQSIRNQALYQRLNGGGSTALLIATANGGHELVTDHQFKGVKPEPLPGVVAPEDEEAFREILVALRSEKSLDDTQKAMGYTAIVNQLETLIGYAIPSRRGNKVLLAQVLLLHGDIVCGLRRPGLRDPELALSGYQRALTVAMALPEGDPERDRLSARANRGRGDALRNSDVITATEAYQSSKMAFDALAADPAGDPARRDDAERALDFEERNLSVVLAKQCRLDEAERALTRSLAGRRLRFAHEHDDLVEEFQARRDMAVGLSTLSELRTLQGRLPEAEEAASENYAIRLQARADLQRAGDALRLAYEQRLGDDPDASAQASRFVASFRRDVPIARLMLARVKTMRGAYDEARMMLAESDAEISALHAEAPNDVRVASDLVVVAIALAENEIGAGDAAGALRWSERAGERLDHLEALPDAPAEGEPELEAQAALRDGQALALAGRVEALPRLEQTVRAYSALCDQDPARAEYPRMLARALAALAGARLAVAPDRPDTQLKAGQEFEHSVELYENWAGMGPLCGTTEAERGAAREALARMSSGAP